MVRIAVGLVLVFQFGCRSTPPSAEPARPQRQPAQAHGDAADDPVSLEASSAPAAAGASSASVMNVGGGTSLTLPGFAPPPPPRAGALRVEGYPSRLAAGMSSPASDFGFTRDGSAFAFCDFDTCCREGVSSCVLLQKDGSYRYLVTPEAYDTERRDRSERRTKRELQKWVKEEGLLHLASETMEKTVAPSPKGEWAYGGEITLVVHESPPQDRFDDAGAFAGVPGLLKVGGRLQGEKTVWVHFPPRPTLCALPGTCYEMQMNALVLSPDAKELGFLTYIRHPSHGASHVPTRIDVNAFAAMVFNATGLAHHGKGDYASATPLFFRALYTDPSRELYAYNLACALARQGDARSEHALGRAIALGGQRVQARADKDADFAKVRETPWFRAAMAP